MKHCLFRCVPPCPSSEQCHHTAYGFQLFLVSSIITSDGSVLIPALPTFSHRCTLPLSSLTKFSTVVWLPFSNHDPSYNPTFLLRHVINFYCYRVSMSPLFSMLLEIFEHVVKLLAPLSPSCYTQFLIWFRVAIKQKGNIEIGWAWPNPFELSEGYLNWMNKLWQWGTK